MNHALDRVGWYVALGLAAVLGVYLRFVGLGQWPLATDEYYVYRAMRFVQESGLPAFPCGGFYERGLVYQYVTVPLLVAGLAPEFAIRLVTVLASLAVLPAVFLLGRRLGGARVAAAVTLIVALSTWEIEMARFARMYAPFQAVFAWYVYHAFRLAEDADPGRWRWLLGLSALGALTWEGGVLLTLANFLPVLMGQRYWRARHLAAALAIAAGALALLAVNFRFLGQAPPPPADPATGTVDGLLDRVPVLALDSPWLAVAVACAALGAAVLLARAGARGRAPATAVVVLALAGASLLANQLLLAALLVAGGALVGWIGAADLRRPALRPLLLLLFVVALGWVGSAALETAASGAAAPVKRLMAFPELLYGFVYPWLGAMPVMSGLIALGTGLVILDLLRAPAPSAGRRLLLAIVLLSLFITGAADTTYRETRYTFHLYPLLLALSVVGFDELVRRFPLPAGLRAVGGAGACVVAFLLGADFAVAHLASIDSYAANFRTGYEVRRERHYYPRFDFRSPARYVLEHGDAADTVIVANVVVSEYLPGTDYVFLAREDGRYRGQACVGSQRERWTGLPLLDDAADLAAVLPAASAGTAWFVADRQTLNRTLPPADLEALGFAPVFESPDRRLVVFRR